MLHGRIQMSGERMLDEQSGEMQRPQQQLLESGSHFGSRAIVAHAGRITSQRPVGQGVFGRAVILK